MARALRRGLSALALLLDLLVAAAPARAECVPFIGGWECDFKNEDTHLGLVQPGWKLISDDAIDILIEDARQAIALYRSTTKTLGDDAIRERLLEMERRVREALPAAIASLARTVVNDPRSLKPIYVDLALCVPYWELIHDERCTTTPELALDLERIDALAELERDLVRLAIDPNLRLGEEWGELAGDVERIRAELDRLETLGRNLDPRERLARHAERFPDYAAMLAGPHLTGERWQRERKAISKTLHATLADTLGAAGETAAQRAADIASLEALTDMSRRAVGRMQAMELSNMTDMQTIEAWTKITEQMIGNGDVLALDMAEALHEASWQNAERVRALGQLPGVGTVLGNESGARRFR